MIDEVLHEIMNSKNLTLQQLSDISDVPIDTLKNLYYGKVKNPKASTVLQLSLALNVTMNYLMGNCIYNDEEKDIIVRYRKCGLHGKSLIDLASRFEAKAAMKEREQIAKRMIPCLIPIGRVRDGIVYNSCNMKEIKTSVENACLAIEITTNFFTPSYCKGDRVLFENRFPENNERAVFTDGQRCFFRRYIENDEGYVLKSLNGVGADMVLKRMDEMECVGTCIGVIRT